MEESGKQPSGKRERRKKEGEGGKERKKTKAKNEGKRVSKKKEAEIMRERKYKNSEIVSKCKKQKQKFECKMHTVRENTWRAEIGNRTTERKIENDTEKRERYNSSKEKRKMIHCETMNSGSHKKDEWANENTTMDVPKTRNVLIKRNRFQAFVNAFKTSTNSELS